MIVVNCVRVRVSVRRWDKHIMYIEIVLRVFLYIDYFVIKNNNDSLKCYCLLDNLK